jgi:hypothetical protein
MTTTTPPSKTTTTNLVEAIETTNKDKSLNLKGEAADVGGLCLSARRLMYEEEYYRSITSTSLLIVPDAG